MGIQGHTFEGQRLLKEGLEVGAMGAVAAVKIRDGSIRQCT